MKIEKRETNPELLLQEFRKEIENCSVQFLCKSGDMTFVSHICIDEDSNDMYVDRDVVLRSLGLTKALHQMGCIRVQDLDELYVIIQDKKPLSVDDLIKQLQDLREKSPLKGRTVVAACFMDIPYISFTETKLETNGEESAIILLEPSSDNEIDFE